MTRSVDGARSTAMPGNDSVSSRAESVAVRPQVAYGGADDDTLFAYEAWGEEGNDTVRGRRASGGHGNDTVVCSGARHELGCDEIYGGDGDDVMYAIDRSNRIIDPVAFGEGGDDTIAGIGTLQGGDGDDILSNTKWRIRSDGDHWGGANIVGGTGNDMIDRSTVRRPPRQRRRRHDRRRWYGHLRWRRERRHPPAEAERGRPNGGGGDDVDPGWSPGRPPDRRRGERSAQRVPGPRPTARARRTRPALGWSRYRPSVRRRRSRPAQRLARR